MSQRSCTVRMAVAAAALLLAMAGPVFAQLQTGDLYAKVVDEKGQPLPGATVTLSGIGAPKVETSNQDGLARFVGLYPGKYAVKADLEGFSSVEYPDVNVQIAGRGQIQLTLSSSIKETITVTADAPLLDERKINRGTTVSTTELNNIPTARDPWSLLSQAPGVMVDRVNVGGNESGQQSAFNGLGSGSRDNTFAVDGVIMTDMAAVGGSSTYYDFGAFEEVQFTVSSTDVTVATSGVTINQVTKRGTNEWKGNARYLRTDGGLQSNPAKVVIPDFFQPGSTLQVDGNKIDSVSEYGADVGGPLWQDHLWGWVSYGRSDIRNIVIGGQPDKTLLKDFNSKLNFQATAADSGVIHYWNNDKLKNGRNAGPGFAPESTWDQTTPSSIYKIEDTFLPSQNLFFTGLYSHDNGKFTLKPKGGDNADVFVDAQGTQHGSALDFAQKATISQERLEGSYFFSTGAANNELKFGGGFRRQDNNSLTVWPHNKVVTDCATLGCDPTLTFVSFPRNRKDVLDATYASAWLQDTVTSGRWTINAGARFDNQKVANRAAFGAANPEAPQGILPALNFPGNNAGGFSWKTVVPRVGVTYAGGAERKTLLRGTFSQYAEQLGLNPLATRVNPIGYSYAYFYFNDLNGNHRLDPNEVPTLAFYGVNNINTANPGSLVSANVNAKNLKPKLTTEFTAGFDQGVGADFAFGLTLTYRDITKIPETRAIIIDSTGQVRTSTAADYVVAGSTPSGLKLPNGQPAPSVPFFKLRDGLTYTGGTLYLNGSRKQEYKGGTVSFTKRMSHQWSARGHFTYADWKWKIPSSFYANQDPTRVVFDEIFYPVVNNDVYAEQSTGSGNKGNVFTGGRWNFNFNAIYQLAPSQPWGVDLTGSVTGREGFATPPYVNKGLTTGRREVLLTPHVDTFRNPSIYTVDARIAKDFKFADFGMTIGIDGFNLFDRHSVLQIDRNLNDGARANSVAETLSPRVFRVGAIFHFR